MYNSEEILKLKSIIKRSHDQHHLGDTDKAHAILHEINFVGGTNSTFDPNVTDVEKLEKENAELKTSLGLSKDSEGSFKRIAKEEMLKNEELIKCILELKRNYECI